MLLQSYRTQDVPAWMTTSMDSVRHWALARGWSYEWMDDRFFDLAPPWVRERCGGNLYAVTDICRLLWLQRALAQGAERVIWVDADVLVFAPHAFCIEPGVGHAYARELFLPHGAEGIGTPVHGINNAVLVFERNDPMLGTYLDACLAGLRALPANAVPRTALGPAMLQGLASRHASPLIDGVGLFTLALMREIAQGGGELTRAYVRHSPVRPAAANLCHFLRNATPPSDRGVFDQIYLRAVNLLLQTQGAVLDGASLNNR